MVVGEVAEDHLFQRHRAYQGEGAAGVAAGVGEGVVDHPLLQHQTSQEMVEVAEVDLIQLLAVPERVLRDSG